MSGDLGAPNRHAALGPGQTLFEFVRHWSRRSSTAANRSIAQKGRYVLIAEAVGSVAKRKTATTINALAETMGIDQSGASRLVKDAVRAGYLEMVPSSRDAREREVTLARAGHRLLVDAHLWQEKTFEQLTADWTDEERSAFHLAMLRLMQRSHTIGVGHG